MVWGASGTEVLVQEEINCDYYSGLQQISIGIILQE